jgi:hypothetical protein
LCPRHGSRKDQARRPANRDVSDADCNIEERKGTISAFNGQPPAINVFDSADEETAAVAAWLSERGKERVAPQKIGVFVRSAAELDRAGKAVQAAWLPLKVLDDGADTTAGYVSVSTIHLAKGLEFRAVAVIACDDEVIPLQERIETAADDRDLEEVYNTERHLPYVACTRARDYLLVTGVDPASEFVDDLRM